ncbi:Outer membrane protein/outer membrane enzyme PagP, beta-barrel,Surface antigen msp4 [Cinara cedri]|uniref:Outer membrane protein/outer membrane enzyme PagP, beta-barrel,Surface antigen msp4 n=1 Tax=Cinara cedri TaxID=506608 RepID=A0A5E4M7Q9_9HEMI|nr:Outer membrane protein/outer membrane enzyme PagP, beta-barrel,Surface antigen msp4 [Cinara cedri]
MSEKELKLGSGDSATSLIGYKNDGAEYATYKPKYKSSLLAGGIAAGYTMEGIRAEFEVLYSNLGVDGSEYRKDGKDAPDNAKAFGKKTGLTGLNDAANAIGTNDGFKNVVAMVNAYYDADLGIDIPVTPYVGGGVGVSRATFVDSVLKYKASPEATTTSEDKVVLQQEGLYGTLGVHGLEAGVMFHF